MNRRPKLKATEAYINYKEAKQSP